MRILFSRIALDVKLKCVNKASINYRGISPLREELCEVSQNQKPLRKSPNLQLLMYCLSSCFVVVRSPFTSLRYPGDSWFPT